MICCALREDLLVELSSSPARAASITCSWSRRGSRSRCPSRSLAWAGGRSSPCRSFLLRRRTDRRHRTRAPKRSLRAASRASPGPLPFEDRDSPQIALVTFPGAVPELSVDPGDAGDEAVGLDRAKNRPCLGIDLMDLPVPILP